MKALGLVLALGVGVSAHAAVVRVEIASRTPIAADSAAVLGQAAAPPPAAASASAPSAKPTGPRYELLSGVFYGELDPASPHNSLITDIALAPRNARGKVEYSATFALAKPVDMRESSGVLFYDVPNRGNGNASADPHGHMHLISGWQGDIPPTPGKQTASVSIARNSDGSPVTGPVLVRFVDMPAGAKTLPITGGIGVGVPRPEPLTLDTTKATLARRRSDAQPAAPIPASSWAFADCSAQPFPGRADPHSICLKDGFDPAFAYELTYTGKDPLVLGIGFAAVRDIVTFFRYGADKPGAPNPVARQVKWAIGTGVSQSGNFVRSFIRLGFNATEDGRVVFDGAHPHIAARQVPLNLRFGVPGGAASLFEPGSEGVLWWGDHEDDARGRGVTSLLDRCKKDRTCPKIVETFGSTEFWGLRMSPDLVGIDARADIPLPPNVRRYYFPGVTHGGGRGGFETETAALPKAPGCELPGNPNPAFYATRALDVALVDWVVKGKEPPPSRYPHLAGDLVPPTREAMGFPLIPKAPTPDGKLNPMIIYDFGPRLRADDLSGEMTVVPPKIVREGRSLVPRVDADGNEMSGVPSVEHRVPLGTYLGWNVQASGYYRGSGCGFQGGFMPFARTRAEREAAGDPRLSLEERYGTHAGFVKKVKSAAAQMAAEGFLLSEDFERIIAEAEASNVLAGTERGRAAAGSSR